MTKPNILLDPLPSIITIGGYEEPVDTDFRSFIKLEKILFQEMPDDKKILKILGLFFERIAPKNIKEAVNGILYLYRCGESEEKKKTAVRKNGNVVIKQKMIYDYEYDAPYIFAAFLSQYRIDLNEIEYLHWWKFQALFRGLESQNKIVEIMSYRATDLSKITDKHQRQRIAEMKRIYALPQNLSFEDKVAMAGSAFGGGFR